MLSPEDALLDPLFGPMYEIPNTNILYRTTNLQISRFLLSNKKWLTVMNDRVW